MNTRRRPRQPHDDNPVRTPEQLYRCLMEEFHRTDISPTVRNGTRLARVLDGTHVAGFPRWPSPAAPNWLDTIEERMPPALTRSERWLDAAARCAASGPDQAESQMDVLDRWIWTTVAPALQGRAEERGHGDHWQRFTETRGQSQLPAGGLRWSRLIARLTIFRQCMDTEASGPLPPDVRHYLASSHTDRAGSAGEHAAAAASHAVSIIGPFTQIEVGHDNHGAARRGMSPSARVGTTADNLAARAWNSIRAVETLEEMAAARPWPED